MIAPCPKRAIREKPQVAANPLGEHPRVAGLTFLLAIHDKERT
jgi:hypothetical protein